MRQTYWCFICETEFGAEEKVTECPACHEQAFEEVKPDAKPQQFEVYHPPNSNPPTTTAQQQFSPFNIQMFGVGDWRQFESALMQNLPHLLNNVSSILQGLFTQLNQSGRSYRPATQAEIEQLEKIAQVDQCAICQSEQIGGEGYRLRCGHSFHKICLTPWLNRANTCPTCRSSL